MAREDSWPQALRVLRVAFLPVLDGARPSGMLGWVPRVAPVVTQAAVGAGHWAAGRRQRARAAWASAAGFALLAWGLGTEVPTRAEAQQYIEQQKDLMRERGLKVPATAADRFTDRQRSRHARYDVAFTVVGTVLRVRYGLRHPPRLTVGAIADEAWTVVFYGLRVPRAVQRRRPRIAVGSALVVAGSAARLWAASAEPLQ